VSILASGEFDTARKGTDLHQFIRIDRCVVLGKIILSIVDKLTPSQQLIAQNFLCGVVEYTHSDDFFKVMAIFHVVYDTLYCTSTHYAFRWGLHIKSLLNSIPLKERKLCFDDFRSLEGLIPKDIVDRYHLCRGTPDGLEIKVPHFSSTVKLYDHATRATRLIKPLTCKVDFDHPGGPKVVRPGVEFLQAQFFRLLQKDHPDMYVDKTIYYPYRPGGRLIAKLGRFPEKLLGPFEFLQKLISCTYLAVLNNPLYLALRKIYDAYRSYHGFSEQDVFDGISKLQEDKPNRDRFKMGNIPLYDRVVFPSFIQIIQFYSRSSDSQNSSSRFIRRPDNGHLPGWDYVTHPVENNQKSMAALMKEARDLEARLMSRLGQDCEVSAGSLNRVLADLL
jgi:hypothetical protein